jgi:nitroreductase
LYVTQAILMKRAVRSFAPRPLPEEAVQAILRAGRRAQSAKNTQPWQFIAVQQRPTLEALSRTGTFAGHLAGAALGVALLTPDPTQLWSILFDAGQAAAYMQLAAWELGIGSCLATIYEPEQARSILGFPEDYHLAVAISFGYPTDPEVLTASPRRGGRRAVDAIVHREHWGGPPAGP